jgi:HEAT repeat protein
VPPTRDSDTPRVDATDKLEPSSRRQVLAFRSSRDEQLNQLIVEAASRMGGVGRNADSMYKESIERLRPRAEAVVAAVASEYRDLEEDQYLERWSMVHLLTDLEHPAALPVLDAILADPIPPERSQDPHSFSTVGEEVMIRTSAIEALARLSTEGDRDVQELLLRSARHDVFSIRRAAVQALVATGDEELIQRLRKILQEAGEERLLEIRRVDVRDVPQAQGGLFLVHPDTKHSPPPPEPPEGNGR